MFDLVARDFVLDLLEFVGLFQILELNIAFFGFAYLPLLVLLDLL